VRSEQQPSTRFANRPHLLTLFYLAFTVLVWGGNWPMLKIAVGDAPPITFTLFRLLGSVSAIGLLLALRRERFVPERGERLMLGCSGFLQIGATLGANMIGLQFLAAGRAAVLTFTMPLWAIPLGMWLLRERPGRLKLLGGLVGLLGLGVFFDPGLVDWSDPKALFGNGVIILGAISWALGAVLYRRRRWRSAFWTQIFWQIAMSGLPLIPVALLFETGRPIHWTPALFIAWAFTAFLGTGVAYWCWARVLTDMPAATAGQVTMLVPVLAFFFSATFFGEVVTLQVVLSIALIFLGLFLTFRRAGRA
jgi:drug/metabolite transporter (DMT)-like permease